MADTNIIVTAIAAISGGAITQLFVGYINRANDTRKERIENQKNSIKKRIEIGESFYSKFRDSSVNLQRLRNTLILERNAQSERGLEYLNKQTVDVNQRALDLVVDLSKWNISDIYFNIESTSEATTRDVIRGMALNMARIELDAHYNNANETERGYISDMFIKNANEIIEFYGQNIERVERDLLLVKTEIRRLTSLLENGMDTSVKVSFFYRLINRSSEPRIEN